MRSPIRAGIRAPDIQEALVVIALSSCLGLLFNLFWVNRIPYITPSKAEIYAQENIPTLSSEKAKLKLDEGKALFLDARDSAEYRRKHIKNALSLPVRHFALHYPKIKESLPRDREIIVYCEGMECGASLHLAQELIRLQYEDVKVFLGGWVEWNRAGYPSE
jgi:rhodanese-related sulfurtransferase